MTTIIQFFKKLFGLNKHKAARDAISKNKKFALVIGIERSAKFGSCPGARTDSNRLKKVLADKVGTLILLQDSAATKQNIVDRMTSFIEQVPPDGIFIMTYSGHGGSQKFADTKDEADGQDEFLCCYDTYLKDDIIWKVASKCRGKVFFFFDCCHSETMFRAPIIPPEDLMKDDDLAGASARDAKIPDSSVDMLVWSGCPDNTYSYGDMNGGLLTNALLNALNVGKTTYSDIWQKIKVNRSLSQYSQVPQQTILGSFDTNNDFTN